MFGGDAGSERGFGFGGSANQGHTNGGGFGARGGGFGGRGFGGGGFGGGPFGGGPNPGVGAAATSSGFGGRALFGGAAAGQGQAPTAGPAGAPTGGGLGPQRPGRGAPGTAAVPSWRRGASGAADGTASQQQQQRGAGGPGRGVFARLGMAALKEGAVGPAGAGSGPGQVQHGPAFAVAGGVGGRGRGGGGFPGGAAEGRQAAAWAAGGMGGRGGATDMGGGGGKSGRGARGGGRYQWARQPQQHQQQQSHVQQLRFGGAGQGPGGGGGVGGGTCDVDVDITDAAGGSMDLNGGAMEDVGGGEDNVDLEDMGAGEPDAAAAEPESGAPWGHAVRGAAAGRAVVVAAAAAGVAAGAEGPGGGRAGAPSRVPFPMFDGRMGGGGGLSDTGGEPEGEDEARLKRRQRRFGQGGDTTGKVNAEGRDGTPPRGTRPSVQWRPEPACSDGGGGAEEFVAGGSPSPPPSPLLPYLGGGNAGDAMADDDDGGAVGGPALVGTCELMCPVAERKRREATGELNVFERLDPENSKLTNESLIIKKARKNYSDEDRRPENLRTFRALGLTMARLRSLIAAPDETALAARVHRPPEQALLDVQAFLWDRYREVRKEIIAQHFHTRQELLPQVLAWNEEIARFLIISSHELWGNKDFAAQLNQEQLKKVLTDLVTRFYTAAARLGVPTANSAEIKCYLLILMLGGTIEKNGRRFRQPAEAQMYLRQYTAEELSSPWTTVLFAVMTALQTSNEVAFFGIMARAPYTVACICASHVMPMRSLAMHMLAAAMGGPHPGQPGGRLDPAAAIPLPELARLLKMSEANATIYAESRQALIQPGGVQGQRDVAFQGAQITAREPKNRPQHWITSKRSPVGRNQDTVNAAPLSPELLDYCQTLLSGPGGAAGPQRPLAVGRLTGPNGPGSPGAGLTATPPRTAARQLQPSTPPSPSPWEFSPGAGPGSGGARRAVEAPVPFNLGSPGAQPVSSPGSGTRGGRREPIPAPSFTGAVRGPEAVSPAAVAIAAFGSPTVPGAGLAAAAFPPGAGPGFGAPAAPAAQMPVHRAFGGGGADVGGAGFQGFAPVAAEQMAGQASSPHLVDAGLLAQAQLVAEARRQEVECIRHQKEQELRQEHERARAIELQCQHYAATAAAAHAALQEVQRREADYLERIAALRLDQQAKAIQERWTAIAQRAWLARWHKATRDRKRREAELRQQLAQASVTFVAGRERSALNLLGRGRDREEAGGQRGHAGRKRRYEVASPRAGVAAPAGQQLQFQLPRSHPAAVSAAHTVLREQLTPHLELAAEVVPGLCKALMREGLAADGRRSRAGDGATRGTAAAKYGRSGPMPQRRAIWKLLLLSGALEMKARCVSAHQLEAAAWLRARLSCGRSAGPRPHRQPPGGEQLTLTAARCVIGGEPWGITLCIQDVSAQRLGVAAAATVAAGGGFGSPAVNGGSGLSGLEGTAGVVQSGAAAAMVATAVAATGGILMLVDGREYEAALAAGATPEEAAAESGQDLVESWEHLRIALSCLPGTHQPELFSQPLAVMVLTLAGPDAADAIRAHLAATASSSWPSEAAARVLLGANQVAAEGSGGGAGEPPSPSGSVSVASLADSPDEVLRQALSYMAQHAPMYEQVTSVDLEQLARGAVTAVVSELDARGGDAATAAATVAAFNQLAAVYEAAVVATASSPSAKWGLPAPEVSPSDMDAAPACWTPHRVHAAVTALRALQMPAPPPAQQHLPGGSALLPQLMGHVATWSAALAAPRQVMLLASLANPVTGHRGPLPLMPGQTSPLPLAAALPAPPPAGSSAATPVVAPQHGGAGWGVPTPGSGVAQQGGGFASGLTNGEFGGATAFHPNGCSDCYVVPGSAKPPSLVHTPAFVNAGTAIALATPATGPGLDAYVAVVAGAMPTPGGAVFGSFGLPAAAATTTCASALRGQGYIESVNGGGAGGGWHSANSTPAGSGGVTANGGPGPGTVGPNGERANVERGTATRGLEHLTGSESKRHALEALQKLRAALGERA